MGANLVQRVFVTWPALSYPAKVVLLRMAVTAVDSHYPDARYFKGWEPLAMALGMEVPDAGAPSPACKSGQPRKVQTAKLDCSCSMHVRSAARRRVDRVIRELVDAGAIIRIEVARAGRRSEYVLNFDHSVAK